MAGVSEDTAAEVRSRGDRVQDTTAEMRSRGDRAPDGRPHDVEGHAALRPLAEHERPVALRVAVAVAALLAAGVAVGAFAVKDLARHGGSAPAGIFISLVFLALAQGMYRRRYWAVLGFEALLAFQIVVTSLALVVAETWLAAGLCALGIGLAGWLFWKLVRVMGRIQATERAAAPGGPRTDEALR